MANDEGSSITDLRIHTKLPPLSPNGDNFPSWKQALSDFAIINGMEHVLDPTYTPPEKSSPLYATHRRNSAIMRMEITNSLPRTFAVTADLEMDAPPLQNAQKIIEHFSDTTTTAYLLVKQEAEHTTLTHDTTLEEYTERTRAIVPD